MVYRNYLFCWSHFLKAEFQKLARQFKPTEQGVQFLARRGEISRTLVILLLLVMGSMLPRPSFIGSHFSNLTGAPQYAEAQLPAYEDEEEELPPPSPTPPPEEKNARYKRFGGSKGLNDIVVEFLKITAEDPRINSFFANLLADPIKLKTFRIVFVEQLCELINGPCHFLGKPMKDAHAGMGIKPKHMKAMLKNLAKAMDKNNVPKKDKIFLLKKLWAMRRDIINAPPKAKPTMSAGGFR